MPRILIIEDDPIYREMVDEVLTDEGFDTDLAENGLEGIDKARALNPDLIISDVVMEGADGYKVLSVLRNEPSTASIPVIMMTGWSSKGGQRQGMSMGADDYLSKPFNATELLDAINAQLKKKERRVSGMTRTSSAHEAGISVLLPAEVGRPLQTIQGTASILSAAGTDLTMDEVRGMGVQLARAAWRIQRATDNFVLYHQLLTLEKDEGERKKLRANTVTGVGQRIQNRVLNMIQARGRSNDVSFEMNDGALPMDGAFVDRVVDELVDNALKFSTPGDPIRIVCAFSPSRFGLSVTDHGLGMSDDQLARVDAFVQHSVLEEGRAGLGLGLAIVRKIAHLHGGGLSIKSKVGEKTRVSVELPITP